MTLKGTDSLQFSTELSTDDTLFAFSPDLNRNLEFQYHSTNDSYANLDTYMYYLNDACLSKSEATANFDILIDGTSNLTTTLRAPAIAAKGHYYGLSALASSSKPDIVDSVGSAIQASSMNDNTYIGVEQLTGVSLISMERIFFNMVLKSDKLFTGFNPEIPTDFGYFFPLAFRSREMVWSEGQVDETFGSQITLQKCKWIFLSLLIFSGILALALSVYYGYRYRNLKYHLPHSIHEERADSGYVAAPHMSLNSERSDRDDSLVGVQAAANFGGGSAAG